MTKNLNGSKIVALLQDLDSRIQEHCRIIICGGAAAIVGYGMKRLTGDIDIFEPCPKSDSFYKSVKDLSDSHGLDPKWINDAVKGFVDSLSPDYQKRLIPLNAGFKNLEVFIISKPDFITMKICAWRETDKEDIKAIGISNDDIAVINTNLAYIAGHSPDRAHKAHLVLSEIGVYEERVLKAEEVSSLAELIQFSGYQNGKEPSIEEIRQWKNKISMGLQPSFLAKSLIEKKQSKNLNTGMDI